MATHNLPRYPTAFVGRLTEIAEVAQRLNDADCHLLTLVGPGGIGKTRLATEVAMYCADQFADGAYFVPLQPLNSPEFMVSAIADAIGFQFHPGGEPKQQFLDYLRDKALLLVLDNFEHLADGAGLLSDILDAAPQVFVLATSRERLNLIEEWVFEVRELNYPANEAETDTQAYDAVQLFVQHARRAQADFTLTEVQKPSVIRICRLVGGMPLAIELAAAWVRALSTEEIARQIKCSLGILETPARNIEPRHRNIRATFEPMWNRLSDRQRSVLRKLSVFRGGFVYEAAEAITGASLGILAELVDKSLLRHDSVTGRYDIHELLRQYTAEQLELAGETEATCDVHSAYYAAFLQTMWKPLRTDQQGAALDGIAAEFDNIRSAWQNMAEKCKVAELSQSINSLWYYSSTRDTDYDALLLCQLAEESLRPHVADGFAERTLGQVLTRQGYFCVAVGKPRAGQALIEEGLVMLRKVGSPEDLVLALRCLTLANTYNNESEAMNRNAESAVEISRRSGDRWLLGLALFELGFARARLGDLVGARQAGQEALEHAEVSGDIVLRGGCLGLLLGYSSNKLGDYAIAKRQFESGIALLRQAVPYENAAIHTGLGENAYCMNDYHGAGYHYRQSLIVGASHGNAPSLERFTIIKIADLWVAQGRHEAAVELLSVIARYPQGLPWEEVNVSDKLHQLEANVSVDAFAAAQERAMHLDQKQIVNKVLHELPKKAEVTVTPPKQVLPDPLTARELEVVRLLATGLSNREIAGALVFTQGTVRWYLNQIYGKLHVKSRTQAILRAKELDLIS